MFQIKKALKSNFLINLFSAKRSPVQQHRWSSCTLVLGHPVSDTIRRILFDSCTIVHDYTHRVHHRTRLIRFRSGASAIRAFKLKFSIRLIFQVHVIFVLSELGTALVTKSFISFDLHVTLFKWFFEIFQPEKSSVKSPQWRLLSEDPFSIFVHRKMNVLDHGWIVQKKSFGEWLQWSAPIECS